jgi:hypothetical protein
VLLICRLSLVAVFAVAAVTKLTDRAGARKAILDFGLPSALATPLGLLLPLAELTVATTLIPVSTAFWGAVGAFVLLLLFVLMIVVNLAVGRRPDCHCFGQLHSTPSAVLLDAEGRIASQVAVGATKIWDIMARWLRRNVS